MGLPGIRGLQPARTAASPPSVMKHSGPNQNSSHTRKAKGMCWEAATPLGWRELEALAAPGCRGTGLPPHPTPFPKQMGKKGQILHFPPGERPGQPRLSLVHPRGRPAVAL